MNGAPWGGSEELWYQTALCLAAHGGRVGCAVYEWPQKEDRLAALGKAGCEIFLLPLQKKKKGHPISKLREKIRYRKAHARAVEALPVQRYYTVVISQGGYELSMEVWQSFYQKLPRYVLLFHNFSEDDRFSPTRKQRLKNWIGKATLNLFAAGKAISVLQHQLSFDIPRAGVFYNPITFVPPLNSTPLPIADQEPVFSVFASLEVSRKAQDVLIGVLSSAKWKSRSWQLHLYGEGPDQKKLAQLIAVNGLTEKVFLLGHTTDVLGALRKTSLVLQLTRVDAMPLTVVEAMALGRPLVVTTVGDMPAWVTEDENGWLCQLQPDAIDAALEKAWNSKARWAQMGEASFRIFQRKFPQQPERRFLQQIGIGT